MKPQTFTLTPDDPHAEAALLAYISSMKRAGERDEDVRQVRELAGQYATFSGKGDTGTLPKDLKRATLEAMLKEDLLDMADKLEIEGRGSMLKQQLVEALIQAEANQKPG